MEIPKPKEHIDREVFNRLYRLFLKHKWLENKSDETLELYNSCENATQQDLIVDLLDRFRMLNSRDIELFCANIAKVICNDWGLTTNNAFIVALCNDSKPDGSQYFMQALKSSFVDYNWKENDFINNSKKITEMPYIDIADKTIVFIDDFIGTGKTASRRILWVKQRIENNIKIKFVALAGMKEAETKLLNLGIDYYLPIILEKGISGYYPEEEQEDKILAMKGIEAKLAPEFSGKKLPSMGYNESESLFAIEGGNTPNNVFPVFWWPEDIEGKRRRTILKRII